MKKYTQKEINELLRQARLDSFQEGVYELYEALKEINAINTKYTLYRLTLLLKRNREINF